MEKIDMEDELVLMNLFKNKRWRALLHWVIAKQQSKKEQAHPVCLQAVEKYEKVDSVNTQNDYETTSKKWADKKKRFILCVVQMCFNSKNPRK